MIFFLLYTLLFSWLIWRTRFLGLLRDEKISGTSLTLLFLGKLAAVPVFYFVYERFYGGVFNYDAGKYYEDVRVITSYAKTDWAFYFRFLFGLQNDLPGSEEFQNVFIHTHNWDNGVAPQFLYNDNRIVIRIHSILDLVSFGSFFVHALFSCFLSFTGIFFLYRSFREYFIGKEVVVLAILCFLPALWFYTGAPLKEGLCLFIMGSAVYNIKKLLQGTQIPKSIILAILFLLISCLLKPYLLLYCELCLSLFFILTMKTKRFQKSIFTGVICILLVVLNFVAVALKEKSLFEAATQHQQVFTDVARGGIFLRNTDTFLRIEDDLSLLNPADSNRYTLKKNIPFTYWELDHVEDTLICKKNLDTLSKFELVYHIPHSNSNINAGLIEGKKVPMLLSLFYNGLMSPLFFNATSLLQMLASFENLIVLLSLFFVILGLTRNRKDGLLPYVFIFMAVSLSLLIAYVAPNSGAIFRYRSPAVVFILLAALYYLPVKKKNLTDPK